MGRIKTQQERDMKAMRGGRGIKKAQEMAEAFAKHKARDFTKAFLKDAGLLTERFEKYQSLGGSKPLEEYEDQLAQEYEMILGQSLAIAYAIGFIDCYEGKSLNKLYVPAGALSKD